MSEREGKGGYFSKLDRALEEVEEKEEEEVDLPFTFFKIGHRTEFKGVLLGLLVTLAIYMTSLKGIVGLVLLSSIVIFLLAFPKGFKFLARFFVNLLRDFLQKNPVKYLHNIELVEKRSKEVNFLTAFLFPPFFFLFFWGRGFWYSVLLAVFSFFVMLSGFETFFIYSILREWEHPMKFVTAKEVFLRPPFFFLSFSLLLGVVGLLSLPNFAIYFVRGVVVFVMTTLLFFIITIPIFSVVLKMNQKVTEIREQEKHFEKLGEKLSE